MSVSETVPDLRSFVCEPDDLFERLDAESEGIALLKLPDDVNPQGLVDRYAELVEKRNLLNNSFHFYNCPRDLCPPGVQPDMDEESSIFHEDLNLVLSAIHKICEDALLPHTTKRTGLSNSDSFMMANISRRQQVHADRSFVTAWLGATSTGYKVKTPDGWMSVDCLPPNEVLITRQADWAHLYPEFSLGDGIEHAVNWEPTQSSPTRAVGILFVGK